MHMLFHLFYFVGKCLQKVMLPEATLTAVVLLWCTQAWLTRLLSLLMDHPTFGRVTKGILTIQFSALCTIQPQAKPTGMQNTREELIKRNIP